MELPPQPTAADLIVVTAFHGLIDIGVVPSSVVLLLDCSLGCYTQSRIASTH